jgi:hypothetical protein
MANGDSTGQIPSTGSLLDEPCVISRKVFAALLHLLNSMIDLSDVPM